MPDIELVVTGKQGSSKSVLLSLIETLLSNNKIPYTVRDDKHSMKINMNSFIKGQSNA